MEAPVHLGTCPFDEGRRVQQRLITERLNGTRGDGFVLCEHDPVISLGRQTAPTDINLESPFWKTRGITLVHADRGGGPTYHAPGQLVIYPVVSLRERGWGPKRFVSMVLGTIASMAQEFQINASALLEPAGVWVPASMTAPNASQSRKIAAVGLRIRNGVTDHGFSINVALDLEPYRHFRPCGLEKGVTSFEFERVENGVRDTPFSSEEVAGRLCRLLEQEFER